MAKRLIDFAASLVGRFQGGLAMVSTVACMLFGSISGSAAAAVSSIGGTLIPEMDRKGYDRSFSIAVTTASATTGLLIPPSNVMIVYAMVASNVSVTALFLGGVIPGLLVGALLMVAARCMTGRQTNVRSDPSELPAVLPALRSALPSLLLVGIVLGGIISGVFTATEASAVAVFWAFLLGVVFYREITFRQLPQILLKSSRTTAIVLFLIAGSQIMSRLLTLEQIPQLVSDGLLGLTTQPITILLAINILLLICGAVMDITPAILIFTPILLPLAQQLGLHPVHFGVMLIANLCIGLCTPPVGTCLFVGCSVGKGDIASVSRAMLPFYFAMLVALALITWVPALTLWLPSTLGEIK
jgi:tripartite ATP-independent transporter DctM subunit